MIRSSSGIFFILLAVVGALLFVSARPRMKKFFKFLPPVFWIYFLPMVLSTFRVIPQTSGVYPRVAEFFLPASLFLLLVGTDLKAVWALGPRAILMMLAGSAGIVFGGPAVLFLFRDGLAPDAWSGFGALSGSWTGGSANMIAVKEIIRTPDSVFLPMVVVDTVAAYTWMGILIALAVFQARYDDWNRSDLGQIARLAQRVRSSASDSQSLPRRNFSVGLILVGVFLGSMLIAKMTAAFPAIQGFSPYTWSILLASIFGILFSFTGLRRYEGFGLSKFGYGFLYLVLASIGARASLTSIAQTPVLMAAGFLWIFIHALFLLAASRIMKVPLSLTVTASQANIGGPVSAPIVAAIYEPSLAPVGLLLGILGNVMGTYFGLLCSRLCYWVSGL